MKSNWLYPMLKSKIAKLLENYPTNKVMQNCRNYIALAFLSLVISGCANDEIIKLQLSENTPEERVAVAIDAVIRNDLQTAKVAVEDFGSIYPFSSLLPEAQLLNSINNILDNEYQKSRDAANELIKLFPGSYLIPSAYFLIAESYYSEINDPSRDLDNAIEAAKAFKELQSKFPDHSYAKIAKIKIHAINDLIAAKEMYIGRWYLNNEKYIAAINRFKVVVEKYENTPQVVEALHRLTEAYLALGLVVEAKSYAALLAANYPESRWYEYAYKLIRTSKNPS